MKTTHKIYYNDASNMQDLDDESVDFVVTSPPYPMIEMWDEIFARKRLFLGGKKYLVFRCLDGFKRNITKVV